MAGYAGRALKSAAGEPHVVRQIVEWLVGQESALLLALPCALVECVQRPQYKKTQGRKGAISFAACYAAQCGELIAALERAARSAAQEHDAISANLGMLARELDLNDTERGVLEVAARYTRFVAEEMGRV